MRIKKKNVARLASISALGAGALGVAAGTAQAGIVNVPLPTHTKVGFTGGYGATAHASILSGAFFGLSRGSTTYVIPFGSAYQYYNRLWGHSLLFKLGDAVGGQMWNQLGGSGEVSMRLGLRQRNTYSVTPYLQRRHSGTNGNFYKLFMFNSSSGNLFGWAYFHQTVSDFVGPDVDILGIAYDNAVGNQIAAGDTGNSGVPEPSTMALAGLAALALGATGLRRWRAARKPAA